MEFQSLPAQINHITEKFPGRTAIEYQQQKITYLELEKHSNQIANFLVNQPRSSNNLLIIMERQPALVEAILGVLKMGGVFAPLDPGFPEFRIRIMMTKIKSDWIITEPVFLNKINQLMEGTGLKTNVLVLNCLELSNHIYPNLNLFTINPDISENWPFSGEIPAKNCYIYFTSGSTGEPKGIFGRHRSLKHFIDWEIGQLQIGEECRVSQLINPSFDASLRDIFVPLCTGGTLCIPDSNDMVYNLSKLIDWLEKREISLMHMVPSLFRAFMGEITNRNRLPNLKYILLAGEMLRGNDLKKFFQLFQGRIELVNLYGATETTLVKTYYIVKESDIHLNHIPVGKPIAQTEIMILDRELCKCEAGSVGEIFIRTPYISSGYYEDPDLTKQVFIRNPFSNNPQDIIYKTGDQGRFLPDGNLECLGRIDQQVKIRGVRIELEEIENRLLQYEGIKETVVTAKDDVNGNKYLCAYFVGVHQRMDQELRTYLMNILPDFMIPSFFLQLEQLPLTPNGKIDRKALPEPGNDINTGVEYVQPQTEIEKKLEKVWQEVLGVNRISMKDNFYHLGGDSLRAIKVLAVLQKHGLTFEMKHLVRFPVFEELVKWVKVLKKEAEEEIVQGEAGLLQTQKRFFSRNYFTMNHWNGGFVFYRKDGFDEVIVKKVFDKIVEYHDALRTVFKFEGERIIQYIRGVEAGLYGFTRIDFRNERNYEEKIKVENRKIQASLDISNGPLMRVVLYKTSEGDHLLLNIHHLIHDAVSVLEIMEVFKTGYQQVMNGLEIRFQPKTDSIRKWAQKISEYASSEELIKEIDYWRTLEEANIPSLLKDAVAKSNRIIDERSITQSLLSKPETEMLLEVAKQAEGIEIQTVLLTAFGQAIKEWTGQNKVLLYLASHGRDNVFEDIDVSRTVGWFANYYPVLLDFSTTEEIATRTKLVRNMLNNIPNHGFGYEILRYITLPGSDIPVRFKLWPEINFNYLGNFLQQHIKADKDHEELYIQSKISAGLGANPDSERAFNLTFDSGILDGVFYLRVQFNRLEYKADTIINFVRLYRENLLKIVGVFFK